MCFRRFKHNSIDMRIFLIVFMLMHSIVNAQRDDIVLQKEKRDFAFSSILAMKEGVLVVRLHTNSKKIELLKRTANDPGLRESQRKRHQRLLDATIKVRDEFNAAISSTFLDSFRFCEVVLMYDTSFQQLKKGKRSGIFLDRSMKMDSSIHIDEEQAVFIVNYKAKSGEFPYDILRIRRLEEKLDEPFPYYMPIRASWLNNINTPRAENVIRLMNYRLQKFYLRALEWQLKNQAKP